MTWLTVLTWFRTNPRNVWLIALLIAIVVALSMTYFKGRRDAHAHDEARQKIAIAAAVKADIKADTKSVDVLARDAVIIDAKQKELEDAVAKIPDTTPDPVAVAAGCVELRRHGISTTDLPACKPALR